MKRVDEARLYELRKLMLKIDTARVALEHAQITAANCQLEIEREYGVLGTDSTIDISTGEIKDAE